MIYKTSEGKMLQSYQLISEGINNTKKAQNQGTGVQKIENQIKIVSEKIKVVSNDGLQPSQNGLSSEMLNLGPET